MLKNLTAVLWDKWDRLTLPIRELLLPERRHNWLYCLWHGGHVWDRPGLFCLDCGIYKWKRNPSENKGDGQFAAGRATTEGIPRKTRGEK